MLMGFDMICYLKPLGDNTFECVFEHAPIKILEEIIGTNEIYSDIMGHDLVVNIDDVKKHLNKIKDN